ncbi:sorting nexin 1 isoform X2 [Arctopsyche grandis]|uniref:sorting nexin 1 isoform X2 n=1 Tax=Arctopsyche grandis TaxID=121162 RepID=UPI00406D6A9D
MSDGEGERIEPPLLDNLVPVELNPGRVHSASEEPPHQPLFETVVIRRDQPLVESPDDDDLFTSAVQDIPLNNDETNGYDNIDDFSNLAIQPPAKNETDDVPIGKQNIMHSTIMEEVSTERGNNIIISVTEPQKVGEGMSSYVAYRVITKTNMRIFNKQNFTVSRRFSDFLGLHDKLTEKYLKTGRIIPPAPEKSVIGMTKIKMSNQSDPSANITPGGSGSSEFVERRRASLERYLNRTAQHPVLCIDPDFRRFLEAEVDLPKATNTSALSGAGVMRLFNKVGETVNKITYKMDETDSWFEERCSMVEALDAALRRLHGAAETLAGGRRELASLVGSVANSAATLSLAEEHAALGKGLSHLVIVQEKVESLHHEQSNTDFYVLCELIKDYIGLLGAIKEVFHERVKVFQHWQHAQLQLNRRRENKAKAELSGRNDKMEQAAGEIIEAKVERGQQEFNNISSMIKKEMEMFEAARVKEFKSLIIRYLEDHMAHQAQLVKYWEVFIPEAKAIA